MISLAGGSLFLLTSFATQQMPIVCSVLLSFIVIIDCLVP